MARFNLNDLMNNKSKGYTESKEAYKHIKVNLDEMVPSENNFYSMDSIEELGKSILMVGLQQPILLGRVEGQYRIISGHRRRAALMWLVSQGYEEFEQVESICTEMSETMFNLSLIVGNAFTRKLTDCDLLVQEQRLKDALVKAREAGEIEIKGKLRDCIAELMDISSTKVAQIEAINNNLVDEVKEEVMKGQVTFSSAYEMSKLEEEKQKEVLEQVKSKEVLGKDIKQMVLEKREQRKQEQFDKEAETVLRQPAAKEQLGKVIQVSESNTYNGLDDKEQEEKNYELIEYTVPGVLEELLEMYQVITEDEFIKILEIFQSCNERMKDYGK